MGLSHDISIIKQDYRELFELAHQRLQDLFLDMRSQYQCDQCENPPKEPHEVLHPDCGYREWQKQLIFTLENTLGKQISETLKKIEEAKQTKGQCHLCGVCCSLASSEFSYETLKNKAAGNDYFAQQFTSVFLPYASAEAAREKFPELVGEILEQADGPVYFYHCPYLGKDNRCTIYNDPKRPQICASYPETPLTLMYKNCGYQPWKNDMLPTTLLAHASLELCQHYANKILEAIKASS